MVQTQNTTRINIQVRCNIHVFFLIYLVFSSICNELEW